jgi:hypothetical protein
MLWESSGHKGVAVKPPLRIACPKEPMQSKEKDQDNIGFLGASIYHEPFWLDIVAPGQWQDITLDKGGGVVGRWPLVLRERFGLTFSSSPPLTPRLGPLLILRANNPAERTAAIRGALQELIAKLPPCNGFDQNLTPELDYWLPFMWAGFKVTPRCTYQFQNLSDLEVLRAGMRDTLRNSLKKAEKTIGVSSGGSFSELADVLKMTFARQNLDLPFSLSLVDELVAANRIRNSGEVFVAKDAKGAVHAAAFVVWDKRSAYYLLGGADPSLRSSGALPFLLWSVIAQLSSVVDVFDFEGSNIEGIERFFSSFGAKPVTYFRTERTDTKAKLVFELSRFAGTFRKRLSRERSLG